MISLPVVDLPTFRRLSGISLPRHVSYPMPTWWNDLDEETAQAWRVESATRPDRPDLALYLHIPFCEALCKFCACNRVVMRHDSEGASDRVERYLTAIEKELKRIAPQTSTGRPLKQIHWGGGTPTYLSPEQMRRLQGQVRDLFDIHLNAEISIEIDPRTTSVEHLRTLRELGFNRLSMGVQDFNLKVQEHVRRVQPFEMVRDVTQAARDLGFESVNFDLIYGMPYQTPDTIRDTIERTLTLSPDRVAYYHYAQIPEKIATQRGMDYTKLPDSEVKLDMFMLGVLLFEDAGYDFIGLDHFAKKSEMLAEAVRDGTIQRNFQGMTTGGGLDLIGVGVSSISHLQGIGFLQNVKTPDHYVELMLNDQSVVERGKRFTQDDLIRQAVINQIYCFTDVRPAIIEEQFGITFTDYFADELKCLTALEDDGLIEIGEGGAFSVTYPIGRVLMRNVAAVFDAYLDPDAYRVGEKELFSANA